jgi:D-beta-D-heptose 7-phosphate kinase/D-beta-D-heptose 1-phosphate adenosyltransferase
MYNFIYEDIKNKIFYDTDKLSHIIDKEINFCNGAFDIIHTGHIELLSYMNSFEGINVIGLNSDTSIKSYKNIFRPINNERDRAIVLAAMYFIDYVIIFDAPNPIDIIKKIKPKRIIKGSDYNLETIIEKNIIKELNIEYIPYKLQESKSTTNVIQKVIEIHEYEKTKKPR